MQLHSSSKAVLQSCLSLFLIVVLLPKSFQTGAPRTETSGPDGPREAGGMRAFQQIAPGQGWILLDNGLYWTENDGDEWREITPILADERQIIGVTFLDHSQGWALIGDQHNSQASYTLARTTDSGQSWEMKHLELPQPDRLSNPIGGIYMDWLDARFGWIVLKFATGSNFSAGLLFVTEDGGGSWVLRSVPLGEPVSFANPRVGWIAGGPARDQLFRSVDGGKTWERQRVGHAGARVLSYSLPQFEDGGNGLLPVIALEGGRMSADFYRSKDYGENWTRVAGLPLGPESGAHDELRLAVVDSDNFLLVTPNDPQIAQMRGRRLLEYENQDGMSGAIVSLSMSTIEAGWGKGVSAQCSGTGKLTCITEVQLLSTRDGGRHWKAVDLPGAPGSSLAGSFLLPDKKTAAMGLGLSSIQDADTTAFVGHGFDTCQIPSLTQMQTWWNRSPYSAVNLYIGGSSRACDNEILSVSYLSQLNAQGWRFIPTWVGPQAACSWYSSRMSWDAGIAYNQGVSQANQALNVAVSLGLAGADKSGTVIYYDLEAYDITDTNCRAAANAFISGWVHAMQTKGNLGAAYGASCGSALTDWHGLANVPDALWVANWYGNAGTVSFDRTASVWGAYCLSDALWSNHQRLRQYAGGHFETWGGLTLEIDSNVIDGPVTVPNGTGGLLAPSRPRLLSPANGATLGRGSNTWLSWKTTGQSCIIHVWGGNSLNITSSVNCSQFRLGVRRGGTYSWQVTAKNNAGSTQGPIWRFNIRPYGVTGLSPQVVSATQVKLTWILSADEPDNVDGYIVYSDGLEAGTLAKGTSTFTVKNLSCNNSHSFYVTSARQGVQSAASKAVSAATPSCAPVLISPAEGATTASLRPRLVWGSVAESTSYRFQVSLAEDFLAPVVDQSLSTTAYNIPTDLAPDTLYFWRARASGPFGDGDWASAASFRTPNPPSIPVLLAPARDEIVTDYTPRFDWEDVTLPAGTFLHHYQIRISTDRQFKTLLYNKAISVSEFTPPVDLQAGTTFYWEVRAVNTLNQYSSWSEIRSLNTAEVPGSPLSE